MSKTPPRPDVEGIRKFIADANDAYTRTPMISAATALKMLDYIEYLETENNPKME